MFILSHVQRRLHNVSSHKKRSRFLIQIVAHTPSRDCPRGEGSYGLTLIRLQSAKDQWVGHINGRTDSRCAPPDRRADGRTMEKAVPTLTRNAQRQKTTERWARSLFFFFFFFLSLSWHAPGLRQQMRWGGQAQCRNVGPFRAKRIISL